MEFDCFKSHMEEDPFPFDSLFELDGFQNVHHLFYDLSGSSLYDPTCLQPHINNSSLSSLGDVNTRSIVKVATGNFNQNANTSIYNDNQQMTLSEDNNKYMIEHVHNSKSSPSQLSITVIHGIDPLKSFPPIDLSNLDVDGSELSYNQDSNMNSKHMQMKDNAGKTHKITNVVKGQWTLEEDSLLIKLVEQYGMRRWSHIAQMIKGRIGKQCRERWHNHLRPNIKKDTWSEEEDKILIRAHSEIGNKWAEIARHLPGRTENSIKNHWNATKRRQFSRRRSCQGLKNPRPSGSLLQDYIQSLAVAPTPPTSAVTTNDQKKSTCSNSSTPVPADDTFSAAPACFLDGNDLPDLLSGKRSVNKICDVAHLFDRLGSSNSEGNCRNFEMATEWGATMPTLMLPTSSENVKREMDLVEMITQSSILHSPF